jgi:hypothetical protein
VFELFLHGQTGMSALGLAVTAGHSAEKDVGAGLPACTAGVTMIRFGSLDRRMRFSAFGSTRSCCETDLW